MTSLSDPNTIHISQSSAFTYNVHLTKRYLSDSSDSTRDSDHQSSSAINSFSPLSKTFSKQEYDQALEALGFVIGSSKIRGPDGKLMCSRYTFKSSHAESFKKSMKFLKEHGYIKSRDRNCAKVCKPYNTLKGLEIALKRDYCIKELPAIPSFNYDHYLITKSDKFDSSMIEGKDCKINWETSDDSKNKNMRLLELCNIVYEYERECNKEENKEKESSPFQNGRTKENLSPFRVEYILNQNDDNNNSSKLPPLKSIFEYPQTSWWGVKPHTPVFVCSNVVPFGLKNNWKSYHTQQDDVNENSDSSDVQSVNDVNNVKKDRPFGKKSRRTVTSAEKDILEKFYNENPYPSRQRYDEIRKRLGWNSSRRVTKWFNNRRYNDKNK